MNFLKSRLKGGTLYEELMLWSRLAKEFPEIVWLKDVVKCIRRQYLWGGSHFSESNYYSRRGGISFKNGIRVVVPKEKDIFLLKDEFLDIILPLYSKNKFDYADMEKYFDEGPYEISEEVSVGEGDVVIDCGANMGLFCATVAERASKIYAFEPSGIIIEDYLNEMKKRYTNIEVQHFAVSDEVGETTFSYNVSNIGASGIGTNTHDKCMEEKVPVTTLDEFVREKGLQRVDFIKADIEGAERKMLAGAKQLLKEFAPKLAICTYHLPDDKVVLEKLILDANPDYIIEHKYKKLYAYVPHR